MIKVGVTGGIGSGKSTVCRLLAELGVPVYDSDIRARELMNGVGCEALGDAPAGGGLRRAIEELLGSGAYCDGILDRTWVADRVFCNRELLTMLNGIVHPAVARDFEAWAFALSDRQYVVLESAILFESGFDRLVDWVITVSAPVELRVERAMERGAGRSGGISRDEVLRRMANQMTDSEREARADYVIDNSGGMEWLAMRVRELDKILKK